MDVKEFWTLIETAKARAKSVHDRPRVLARLLRPLNAQALQSFQRHYDEALVRANRQDLWGVLYLMQAAGGDDSFEYCRNWLISEGRVRFECTLQDAESLIEGEPPHTLEGFGSVAGTRFAQVTGGGDIERTGDLWNCAGRPWEEKDLAKRFPRVFARYGQAEHSIEDYSFDFPEGHGIRDHFLSDGSRGFFPPKKQFFMVAAFFFPVKGFELPWLVNAWVRVSEPDYHRLNRCGAACQVRAIVANCLPSNLMKAGTRVQLERDAYDGEGPPALAAYARGGALGRAQRDGVSASVLRRLRSKLPHSEFDEPPPPREEGVRAPPMEIYRDGCWIRTSRALHIHDTDVLAIVCPECGARAGVQAADLMQSEVPPCPVCTGTQHRVYGLGGIALTLPVKLAKTLEAEEIDLPTCSQCTAEGVSLGLEASCYVDEENVVHFTRTSHAVH